MLIQKQINELQFNLNNLNKFLANLTANGTMINPQIKTLSPFDVYYIEKVGSYGEGLESIKKEMSMMQDSFSKTLPILAKPFMEKSVKKPTEKTSASKKKGK